MDGTLRHGTVVVLLAVATALPACDPEPGDEGRTLAPNPIGGCDVEGRDVLFVVETSARMAAPSGFLQGGKDLSRFDLVVEEIKGTVPHLKSEFELGLLLFPFKGKVDKKGKPTVDPDSCEVGDVLIDPGSPYGWVVSDLMGAAIGGRAAVGTALHRALDWFAPRPSAKRVRSVMLFIAGGEECGEDAVEQARLLREAGVGVYVFTYNDVADPDGRVAEIAAAGGAPAPTLSGAWGMVPGAADLILAAMEAASIEVCDGRDNDCDGLTDDDLVRDCPCGDGTQECRAGDWGPCLSEADFAAGLRDVGDELCDGKDNDCDLAVDETFGVGLPCLAATGACQSLGTVVCTPDRIGSVCSAVPPVAAPETCDGVDNDCDGSTDEGVVQACSSTCGTGQQACVAGVFGPCVIVSTAAESCDGIDNDCDGATDEGFNVGAACALPPGGPCSAAEGKRVCTANGLGTECKPTGGGTGSAETCNGADDDCDGATDEGAGLCAAGMSCFKGECVWD